MTQHEQDTDSAQLNELATGLAIAVETNDEDTIWECVFSIKEWALANGNVSFWGVEIERNGVRQFLDGWWLRRDQSVMDRIDRSRGDWDLSGVDHILVFKDYAERLARNRRIEPIFVVPVKEAVDWMVEGF